VAPYPDPLYGGEEAAAQGRRAAAGGPAVRCPQVSLTAAERAFIEVFLHELNRRIHDAATDPEFGFTYLAGMERALADAGLQLCDPLNAGRPGLSFLGLRSVNGDPSQRFNPANWTHNSLHPNERGHAAMLRVFQNWLATQDTGGSPVTAGFAAAGSPGCDIYGDLDPTYYPAGDGVGCVGEGDQWALRQLGRTGLWAGPLVLVAAAGAWLASIAFLDWRRSRQPRTTAP
jgi:hypothetical protein